MKNKKISHMWFAFLMNTFLTTLISVFIISITFSINSKFNLFNNSKWNSLLGLTSFILLNITISAVFTSIFAILVKRFMKPINKLIQATEDVAKGDFTIRLDETYHKHEIKTMYTSFNKMVKELNSIETLRNDFIINVSHEFKTPIAAIEGYATLLQDKNLSEDEKNEYTKIILESAKQLSSLSGNILKLSKLETQEIVPEKKYFYLDEQLRQALILLENQWSKKDIDIDMDLRTTYYYGCEDLLMQVWINLFSNAIKFTPEGGLIATRLKNTDDGIYISISDTGIGMSKEVQDRIFEKFYQGDKSRNFEGNGLGLTLVKKILDLCKYSIDVSSEINKGTTFTIFLPIEIK